MIIGVTALVATEGPWVRDGEMPERSTACALQPHVFFRPEDAKSEAAEMYGMVAFIEGELSRKTSVSEP